VQVSMAGEGPFHWACRHGFIPMMKALLDKEAAQPRKVNDVKLVNACSPSGETPLMVAVLAEQNEVFE
jgi:ankyrin repeat protein